MRRRRLLFVLVLVCIVTPPGIYLAYRLRAELVAWHIDRGGAAIGVNDHIEAIREFQAALRMDPRGHVARNALASAYESLGDHAAAIRELKAGVEADPRSLIAHGNLAEGHFAAGEYEAALPAYQDCVRFDPGNPYWRILVGRCHAQLGNIAQARKEFEGVLAADPDNMAARHSLDGLNAATSAE